MAQVVDIALRCLGFQAKKYQSINSGNSPPAFDCSGFVQWALTEAGIVVPFVPGTSRKVRHSEEFYDYFGFMIHSNFARRGDLVFFSSNGYRPTHLGFYLGSNDFVHSPGIDSRIVEVRSIDDYLRDRPLQFISKTGREQIYASNPIGFKRIAISTESRFQKVL